MKKLPFLLSATVLALIANPAQASVTIAFTQDSAGVGIDVQGSLDTSSFDVFYHASIVDNYINPASGAIYINDPWGTAYNAGPKNDLPSFGSGGHANPTSASGTFGLFPFNPYWSKSVIVLPRNYVSGSALSASSFYAGATFASLGIDPTDFIHEIVSGQTINITFATAASGVPEPATWAMMILGMGMVGAAMRRRAQHKPQVHFNFT